MIAPSCFDGRGETQSLMDPAEVVQSASRFQILQLFAVGAQNLSLST